MCTVDVLNVYASEETNAQDTIQDSLTKIIDSLDLSGLEGIISKFDFFGERSLSNIIIDIVKGQTGNDYEQIISEIKNTFIAEITEIIALGSFILLIVVLISVINAVGSAKENSSLFRTCETIANILIITSIVVSFFRLFSETKDTIDSLTKEVQVVFPIMLTLMTAAGGDVSVAVFKPAVALLCNGITTVFEAILLPIVIFIFLFSAVNCFTNSLKTDKMNDFLKSAFKWVVGLSSVFFCFLITVQGISASIYDNVSIKALKYAVGNSIPLINNVLSSGFDVVIASCVLVKNALGILAMLVIIVSVAVPILKLVFFSLILKFVAAISQSIAGEQTVKLLSGASDCVSYLSVTLSVVSIMYIITLMLIMCSLGAAY